MKKLTLIQSIVLTTACINTSNAIAETDQTETINIPSNVQACVGLVANAQRLACYDKLFILNDEEKTQLAAEKVAEREFTEATALANLPEPTNFSEKIAQSFQTMQLFREGDDFNPNISFLDKHWELSENSKLGTWNVHTYKPTYALPIFLTSNKNTQPHSENPNNSITQEIPLNSIESKFQISLKTKALENIFGNNSDLWLGYTQSSRWQVYNGEQSRPFRETNYEPEAMLMFRTNYELLGLNARLLGIGFNHQSNGSNDPISRSWNRVIFNLGLEKDNFAIVLRPWIRIPEAKAQDDNNPKIADYMGRGDLTAYYSHNKHNFSLMLRHSLKSGDRSHGAIRFDWTFPIHGKLRGHVQAFNGYGESLIDYNHRASYFGLGVSLADGF